ncbi:alpha/beta hydrolase [Streptomyces zinciresistens]|uniref:alpha/beta hydrolase n=1 Tax=Streptomyces zinciresistens TaxID=1073330 RepID=UPI00142F3BBF|nr:alpha/beta hydrolase [Streptomyces zinciresistens]
MEFDHTGLNVHVHPGGKSTAAVVFVHGLGGTGYDTWGMWPELVFTQKSVEPLDVILYQYASLHKAWRKLHLGADLPFISSQLADWIRVLGEDHGYTDIYLVSHSLGGLVVESAVQKYLVELGTGAPQVTVVAAIFLLASPRMGAGLALGAFRQLLPEIEWLRDKSEQAMVAESYFRSHVESSGTVASAGDYDFLIPRHSAMAGDDRVVSKMSGLFGVPEQQRLRLNGDHRSIVKPDAVNQEQHRRLLKIVRQSGENRRVWRLQARHDARFDKVPGPQGPLLITELGSDNGNHDWELAYNKGCTLASLGDVQVRDRRNPAISAVQPTDLLIIVHDAKSVMDGNERCRTVVDKAFQRHQAQEGLVLLIVLVGSDSEEAKSVVQSWLPEPPYRSLSINGVATVDGITHLVAQWADVVVGRDPIRWPRSASGQFYGAEGRYFV